MRNDNVKLRLRILMVIPELGFGGAEKVFVRLYEQLTEYHKVSIAVFKRHYAKGGYTHADDGISVPVTILDSEKPVGRVARWAARWRKLRYLKRENDITISFLTGANILNVATGRCGGQTIISMHGSRQYDPAFTRLKRFCYEHIIDPLTFMFAGRIVSVSEGLTSELSMHVKNKTRDRIVTIEAFVDADKMIRRAKESIENEIEQLKGQPVIISAGRMSAEKGFQYLIPVFAKVRQRVPKAKLVMLGDGPLFCSLQELCDELELPVTNSTNRVSESAVIFLGYQKDPYRYFRIARLFVLSSLTEGFPNAVIEGLAAGVPVLAVDCPWGPRSILWERPRDVSTPYPTEKPTQADYGILMPRIDQPRFDQIWVDTITTMLDKPNIDIASAEAGRDRVRELDVRRIGQKWLDLVDELGRTK